MEIIADTTEIELEQETAVAIGKFDGIHVGHRRLLEEILSRKDYLKTCVFTFDPPPAVLFGSSDGKELTTRDEKRLLFGRLGVDILIEFPMNWDTAAISAESFAREILAGQMQARFLVAGTDLSFGARGAGNAALLRRMGAELGLEVRTIAKVCMDGEEVSSSLVRAKVEAGHMEAVEHLLGMPYMIAGEVVRGRQIGRELGFPTVNVIPGRNKLLPPSGVYLSQVRCGGKLYSAISNVGCKPTVTDERVMGVESYLYDFTGDLYGRQVEIYLRKFKRPEKRFENIEALQRQLQEDIATGIS